MPLLGLLVQTEPAQKFQGRKEFLLKKGQNKLLRDLDVIKLLKIINSYQDLRQGVTTDI